MSQASTPEITPFLGGSSFTCISFEPDLKRFGMQRLDTDLVQLMKKRVYDLAGVLPKIKVTILFKKKDNPQ